MLTTLTPELLVEGLNALFLTRVSNEEQDIVRLVANVLTTTKRTETFPFLGDAPSFRKWVTRRKSTVLSTATYSMTVDDWESSLDIDMRDLQDEQIPMLADKVGEMADKASRHRIQLIVEEMVNATTTVGYDGVSFFNDAHPARGNQTATQDNNLAASGTTVANLQADYDAAHVAMSRFVDEEGEVYHGNVRPDFLVVAPPELFRNWSTVLFNTTQPNNDGQNVYRGQGDLATTARLTDTADFYMLKVNGTIRPFIFLERQGIQTTNTMMHTETYRPTKQVTYGADARYTTGVNRWQFGIKFS